MNKTPIGIFDSGLGGLAITRELRKHFPNEDFIYLADAKYCPYGTKTNEEIKGYVTRITSYFVGRDVKGIVIACNTATANSNHLTLSIPVIGMIEPTCYEVSKTTKNKKVLVIATSATVRSNYYSKYLAQYGIKPTELACQKFVTLVEEMQIGQESAQKVVTAKLKPYVKKDIDTIVLGCTHFGFLKEEIKNVLGNEIIQIDGSKEVANRLKEELLESKRLNDGNHQGTTTLITTGDFAVFEKAVKKLGIEYDKITKIDI